jgi:hypothetical protein
MVIPKYLNFATFSHDLLAALCCDCVLRSVEEIGHKCQTFFLSAIIFGGPG